MTTPEDYTTDQEDHVAEVTADQVQQITSDTADTDTNETPAATADTDTDTGADTEAPDQDTQDAPAEDEQEDAVANAAAALGDTTAEDHEAAYRKRLREFVRDLKKQDGEWYIVQTYSGYENKVKTNLDMRAVTLEVEEYIHEVVVPIEQAIEIKDGKKKLVKKKLLPGYVLVRMEMNDRAWSVVRDTPGVTSFVGNEGNATAVKHRDVAKFLMPKEAPAPVAEDATAPSPTVTADGETVVAMPEEDAAPKIAMDFEVGDAVTILEGAFASVSASISAIDPETGKIQALVSIFGRETPVELTADQIEKIV